MFFLANPFLFLLYNAVYTGHEYTVSNLKFAITVDFSNKVLADAFAAAKTKRKQGLSTHPTTVSVERATNPFMRTDNKVSVKQQDKTIKTKFLFIIIIIANAHKQNIQSQMKTTTPVETMAALRSTKNKS